MAGYFPDVGADSLKALCIGILTVALDSSCILLYPNLRNRRKCPGKHKLPPRGPENPDHQYMRLKCPLQ